MSPYPLDLARTPYAYLERPNRVLVSLMESRLLRGTPAARILDVGCGCGTNASEIRSRYPNVTVQGIEPNPRAAGLSRSACNSVFEGTASEWIARAPADLRYDAVVLSDVLEHLADPVALLQQLKGTPQLRGAAVFISVPNYAVWHNRVGTLLGRMTYGWHGLFDRTHLRFFTRRTILELVTYCGLDVVESRCTPSIVHSAAPILRRFFEKDVTAGDHLALTRSPAFRLYGALVEPAERRLCELAPTLLGFQIVLAARPKPTVP